MCLEILEHEIHINQFLLYMGCFPVESICILAVSCPRTFLSPPNGSCGKVMFSQAFINLLTGG